MNEINSPHGGTFSEGIPNFTFIPNMECFSKCPNCELNNFYSGYCFNCKYGYSNKEQILKIIVEENTMTPEEIAAEREFIKGSRGKERGYW